MSEQQGFDFANAIAERDAGRLKELLADDLDFRAVTPRKIWEFEGIDALVDTTIMGTWFTAEAPIVDVINIEHDQVGTRERVGYTFRVEGEEGPSLVQQQAFYDAEAGKITWLRILCSGYQPIN